MKKQILSIILCVALFFTSVMSVSAEFNVKQEDIQNLAKLSTTVASSSRAPSYGSLEGGIDGNPDTFCYISRLNIGNGVYEPGRYILDFGTLCVVTSVSIKNRPEGDTSLNYLKIELSNDPSFVDAVEIFYDDTTKWSYSEGPEVAVSEGEAYRYLRVSKLKANTAGNGLLAFADLEVMGCVAPEEFKIMSLKGNDKEIKSGDRIDKSIDSFEIEFNNAYDFGTVNTQSVSVIRGEDTIDIDYQKDEFSLSTLILALKETLVYGDTITVTLNGVKDINEQSLSQSYTLTVGDSFSNTSVVDDIKLYATDGVAEISGRVISSKGVGISGRQVNLTVTAPEDSGDYVSQTLSQQDGSFEFTYDIPEGFVGKITCEIEADYADTKEVSIRYLGTKELDDLTKLSTTVASSSREPNYGSLEGGIDGNPDTFCYISRLNIGNGVYEPGRYILDFGIPCAVTSVSIKNRTEGDTSIDKLKIELSNDPTFNNSVEIFRDDSTVWAKGDGPEVVVGEEEDYRYLRVSKLQANTAGNGLLAFADLTVMGHYILPKPGITKISYLDKEVTEGAVIARGLGQFVLDLTTEIDISTVNSDNIYLCANGESIPLEFKTEGSTLTLKLKKSLPFGADVKLVLKDIKDVFSQDFNAEYGFSVAPIDAGLEETMLASVKSSSKVEDIKTAFSEENCKAMGIISVENRGVIENYDNFYSHFIAKEYSTADLLADAYEEYVVLETINQAKLEGDIDTLLSIPVNCDLLGVSFDRIGLVDSGRTVMLEELLGLEPFDEVDEFSKKGTEIIEKYVALEAGKNDVETVDNTMTVYEGQGAELELAFLNEETSVSAVKFVLTSTNEASLSDASVELDIEGTYEKTIEDGVLTINIIPIRTVQKAQRFGTVTLTVPADSSAYNVTVSGTVTYKATLNEENTLVTTNIIPKTSTVSFTQSSSSGTGGKTDTSTSRPSSSFGGGGNGGITVTPVTPNTNSYFTDLATSLWAEEAVNALTEKGIVSKSADGKFYPERILTREEFVKLIVEALDLYDADAKSEFTDVSEGSWYAPYVAIAYKAGFALGKGDGTFGSGESISREDMAVMLMRACKFNETASSQFADDTEIADYAKDAVYTLKSLGIINGTTDTHFSPKANATRAMAAKVIFEMLKEVA